MHLLPQYRRNPPYIGDSDADIRRYINKLAYAVDHYGHEAFGLTADDAALIFASRDAYEAVYQKAKSPTRTKPLVARKNEARDEADRVGRMYAMLIKHNPNVPIKLRVTAGVNLDKKTRTPSGKPRTCPCVTPIANQGNVTELRFRDLALTTGRLPRAASVSHLLLFAEVAPKGKLTRKEHALRLLMPVSSNPIRVEWDAKLLARFGLDETEGILEALYRGQWLTSKSLLGPMGLPKTFVVPYICGSTKADAKDDAAHAEDDDPPLPLAA